MNVLVTGGSGFLGSHVAERLSLAGHSVRALVRRTSNRKFLATLPNLEFFEGSVEEADRVSAAVLGVDAIIHVAGLVKARNVEEFNQTNVEGTRNLIEAAKTRGSELRRFVLVSSLEAIGPSADGTPVDQQTAPHPVTSYGRSKLAAEQVALAAKDAVKLTILRPGGIYGPRDNETFAFFKSIKSGALPMIGDGSNVTPWVYAEDCADACICALTAEVPSGSAYFVDDGQRYVWRDQVAELERAMGKRALLRFGLPMAVASMVALGNDVFSKVTNRAVMLTRDKLNGLAQRYWVCDTTATRRDLGWEPKVLWPQGVELAARWYRDNSWL